MTPWSVSPSAGISSSAARAAMRLILHAPSSSEYSLWTCRWTTDPLTKGSFQSAQMPPHRVSAFRCLDGGRSSTSRLAGPCRRASVLSWRSMEALVTGGAGFIGSHLVDALLGRGDRVVVIDDLSTGRRENLDQAIAKGAMLLEAEITDAAAVAEAFEAHRPELVFHLAAQIDVRRSVSEPVFDLGVNVAGTLNLLEAARRDAGTAPHPRLNRRRDLRRGRRTPSPPGRAGRMQAGRAVRPEQVRGRGLSGALQPSLRPLHGGPAAGQRLRIAAGPARGGRRGGDLLRGAARRRHPEGVRRRSPDARLRVRRRRCRGVPGGGGVGRQRHLQHRHRRGDQRARAGPAAGGASATGSSIPRWLRRDRERCSGSRSTARGPSRSWAGGPRPPSSRACGRPRLPTVSGRLAGLRSRLVDQ